MLRKLVLPLIFLAGFTVLIFRPFFFSGKLPIPADAIVGMYHPWRDWLATQYPSGVPIKNSLITDAVRQHYPWRQLAIEELKSGRWPVWNPYSFSGTPLLANPQTAAFYPLNILYWLSRDFALVWSWQVVLQIFWGSVFMFLFLRHLRLAPLAAIFGALSWSGSGFFISWLETNVVIHAAVWLPLALLAVDKLAVPTGFSRPGLVKLLWGGVFGVSLLMSFLAGHLQVFFYLAVAVFAYVVWCLYKTRKYSRAVLFASCFALFFLILAPQWLRIGQFVALSARGLDQAVWQKADWFLPWQNLVQFIAPDFFGNPATGNYFGVWNYGEFVGYIGAAGLLLAIVAIALRVKRAGFYILLLTVSLVMSLPTLPAEIPFRLSLPFVSTAQPSRLLVLVDFSLAVLAAFGLEEWLAGKIKWRAAGTVAAGILAVISGLWLAAGGRGWLVSQRNLILPAGLFGLSGVAIFLGTFRRLVRWRGALALFLLALVVFDLFRFTGKFLSFSPREWLFPQTKTTTFLQEQVKAGSLFRLAAVDERVMAANFSVAYRLPFIGGYDPLYLARYGEFVAAMERGRPDVSAPFGFNRIITPKNYESKFFDLLGVQYVLDINEIVSSKYKQVFQEGVTRVYENRKALPRAFFVGEVVFAGDKQAAIEEMYKENFAPAVIAVGEGKGAEGRYTVGKVREVREEREAIGSLIVETENDGEGFLVVTEVYYPSWRAEIDGRAAPIFLTDYTFLGIRVPAGRHRIKLQAF